jgi:hypothetical protein
MKQKKEAKIQNKNMNMMKKISNTNEKLVWRKSKTFYYKISDLGCINEFSCYRNATI